MARQTATITNNQSVHCYSINQPIEQKREIYIDSRCTCMLSVLAESVNCAYTSSFDVFSSPPPLPACNDRFRLLGCPSSMALIVNQSIKHIMPWKPPVHRPCGWSPAKRERRDPLDRSYGTQAWRKLAAAIVARDKGICHVCGKGGADTAHHLVERRHGGSDHPSNLRAIHRGCHNQIHTRRGV